MLSKTLTRGEHITVAVPTVLPLGVTGFGAVHPLVVVVRGRVWWTGRGKVMYHVVDHTGPTGSALRRRDEGTTWARGWEGPDADALRAQVLLQGSAR